MKKSFIFIHLLLCVAHTKNIPALICSCLSWKSKSFLIGPRSTQPFTVLFTKKTRTFLLLRKWDIMCEKMEFWWRRKGGNNTKFYWADGNTVMKVEKRMTLLCPAVIIPKNIATTNSTNILCYLANSRHQSQVDVLYPCVAGACA